MKFSTGRSSLQTLSNKHKFHANQHCESHILHKGIIDMLLIFSTFFNQLG